MVMIEFRRDEEGNEVAVLKVVDGLGDTTELVVPASSAPGDADSVRAAVEPSPE